MAPETPKGVSSRLLTMKFMQRAAAASSPASSDADTPSAKKRKFAHSPSDRRDSLNIDQLSVKAALEEQEAKRQAALQQHSGNDTQWVLNASWQAPEEAKVAKKPAAVVYVGFGDMDSGSDSDQQEDKPARGRMSTMKKKPAPSSKKNGGEDDEGDDSSQQSSSEAETPDKRSRRTQTSDRNKASSQSKARSRSRPSRENSKAKEFRDARKKKEIRLNKLTSISSAGR